MPELQQVPQHRQCMEQMVRPIAEGLGTVGYWYLFTPHRDQLLTAPGVHPRRQDVPEQFKNLIVDDRHVGIRLGLHLNQKWATLTAS